MFRRNAISGAGAVVLALLIVAATPVVAGHDDRLRASTASPTGGDSAGTGRTAPSTTTTPTTTTPTTTTTTVLPPLQPDGTAAAGRPPQFVVVSFDGVGSVATLEHWRAIAEMAHARFSFFLSGVYLLDAAHKSRYVGPHQSPGASSIGFAKPPDAMSRLPWWMV